MISAGATARAHQTVELDGAGEAPQTVSAPYFPWMSAKGAKAAATIFLVWTAVGAFQAIPDTFKGFQWLQFTAKLIEAWTWMLLTPGLLLIDRSLAAMKQTAARLTLVALVFSVPMSLLHTYLCGLLLYPLTAMWWNPLRNSDFAIYYFVSSWLTYSAAIGMLQAFRYHHRFFRSQLDVERLERRLVETRLNLLYLQLEPHFLFNALNTISGELTANPHLARDMIENLGALLRQSIDCEDRHKCPLAQELALLERYLAIQRVRFGDRMDVRIEVDRETLGAEVPPMLLQPLIENAIRHGIEKKIGGGAIVVSAERADAYLLIRILDNGPGFSRGWRPEQATGLGLRTTRERLEALYPGDVGARLAMSRRVDGVTEVEIRIPWLSTEGGKP